MTHSVIGEGKKRKKRGGTSPLPWGKVKNPGRKPSRWKGVNEGALSKKEKGGKTIHSHPNQKKKRKGKRAPA